MTTLKSGLYSDHTLHRTVCSNELGLTFLETHLKVPAQSASPAV